MVVGPLCSPVLPARFGPTSSDVFVAPRAGGDCLLSSCPTSTETTYLTALNCVLNPVVSDDAFLGTIDLTDFYRGTPVTLPLSQRQYIRIDFDTYYSPGVHPYRHCRKMIRRLPNRSDHVCSEGSR